MRGVELLREKEEVSETERKREIQRERERVMIRKICII